MPDTHDERGGDCAFCAIVAGAAPVTIVREWHDAIAFVPLGPVVPGGHILVVPRRHVADAVEDPTVTAATMARAAELAAEHEASNILTSIGRAATQSIFHLHIHVIRRAVGDQLMVPWGTTGDPQAPHSCKRSAGAEKQLAAATALAEKAEALVADAEMRADKFCGAFSDAGSLAYRRGKLLDEAITRQAELAKERDEARELACASLDILRNVSDEPMRELFEVDDMDEMPAWFTGYGKPPAAVAPDALQEALSEPVERSEASGGHGEGSNSRATAAGLSEPHAFVVCATCNGSGGYCQRCREGQAGLPHCAHIVTCPDCLGGGTYPPATEDGQHG